MTRVDLKTFTFSAGSKSRSIDNAVLGPLPKLLLYTMIKDTEFNGSVDTTPYKFRHYDISELSLYVNGRRVPREGLSLDMDHKKTCHGYTTLFEESGIHHSNTGLQITNDIVITGFFMLVFDLTPDHGASEVHTSLPEDGNVRIELHFSRPLLRPLLACCTSNTTVLS